jgi:hypothetical protein
MGAGVGPNTVCYAKQILVVGASEKAEDFPSTLAHYFGAGIACTCKSNGRPYRR